ncbi:hypothetical protein Tco_0231267 [Tanacetum coccineum]
MLAKTLVNNVFYCIVFSGFGLNMFSIKFHHGGRFTNTPGRIYVNGYTWDRIMYYQYLIHDLDLDNGLRDLGSDQDVLELVRFKKSKLKELRKQLGKNADGGKNQPYFYVGQSFRTAKAAKERIKLYSIETMR